MAGVSGWLLSSFWKVFLFQTPDSLAALIFYKITFILPPWELNLLFCTLLAPFIPSLTSGWSKLWSQCTFPIQWAASLLGCFHHHPHSVPRISFLALLPIWVKSRICLVSWTLTFELCSAPAGGGKEEEALLLNELPKAHPRNRVVSIISFILGYFQYPSTPEYFRAQQPWVMILTTLLERALEDNRLLISALNLLIDGR